MYLYNIDNYNNKIKIYKTHHDMANFVGFFFHSAKYFHGMKYFTFPVSSRFCVTTKGSDLNGKENQINKSPTTSHFTRGVGSDTNGTIIINLCVIRNLAKVL